MIPAAAFVPLLYNPEGKPLVVHHSLVRWSRLAKKAIDTMDEQEQNACRKYGLGQLLEKCTKATGCPSAAPRAMATRFAPRTAFWCACPEREKEVSTIGVGQLVANQLAAVPNVLPRDRRGFGAIRVSALGNTFQVMQTRAGVGFGTTGRCAVRQCFRNRFRDLRANQVQWDDAH